MIYRLIFNRLSGTKKKQVLTSRGVNIGCFNRDERKVHVYLLDNFFVEVFYHKDDSNNELEKAKTFTNYRKLEVYMEESFKKNF